MVDDPRNPNLDLTPRTAGSVPEPHLPHKEADDTEQVYYEGSPMLRGEMGRGILWIIAGLIAIAIPILLSVFTDVKVPWWGYLIAVVVGLILISLPWLRARSVRYRISNYRIDYQRGLLSRDIDTMELWHVEDIRFHQSILDRLLGVGTISVLSHDETSPDMELRGLPNPQPLFEAIKHRVIAVKRQRGVIKMDTGS